MYFSASSVPSFSFPCVTFLLSTLKALVFRRFLNSSILFQSLGNFIHSYHFTWNENIPYSQTYIFCTNISLKVQTYKVSSVKYFIESEVAQSCPTLCDLWTVAHQAPPSMGFSRQEYWSGLPFPSPGDLPHPGIEPRSPALQEDALTSAPPGKPKYFTSLS